MKAINWRKKQVKSRARAAKPAPTTVVQVSGSENVIRESLAVRIGKYGRYELYSLTWPDGRISYRILSPGAVNTFGADRSWAEYTFKSLE